LRLFEDSKSVNWQRESGALWGATGKVQCGERAGLISRVISVLGHHQRGKNNEENKLIKKISAAHSGWWVGADSLVRKKPARNKQKKKT
jgi:hypothetical protein